MMNDGIIEGDDDDGGGDDDGIVVSTTWKMPCHFRFFRMEKNIMVRNMKYKYCCPNVCSQCIQLNAKYLVLLSVAIPMATRAIIGPLTFYPTFVATEAFKVTRNIQQIIAIAYQLD